MMPRQDRTDQLLIIVTGRHQLHLCVLRVLQESESQPGLYSDFDIFNRK